LRLRPSCLIKLIQCRMPPAVLGLTVSQALTALRGKQPQASEAIEATVLDAMPRGEEAQVADVQRGKDCKMVGPQGFQASCSCVPATAAAEMLAIAAWMRPCLSCSARASACSLRSSRSSSSWARFPSSTFNNPLARDQLAAVPVASVDIRGAEPDQVNRSALEPAFHQLEDDQRRARPVLVPGALLLRAAPVSGEVVRPPGGGGVTGTFRGRPRTEAAGPANRPDRLT
jgi:hypothetical protein